MNDRELIELVAKAAGVDSEWHNEDDSDFDAQGCGMWIKGERTPDNNRYWNPLRHDGDALRLASKLWLCIEFGYCLDDSPVVRCGQEWNREEWKECPAYPDRNDAIRRAIVSAAAAIGQSMP